MKKLSFLTAAIWALGLIIIPQAGIAKMTVMSDQDLRQVTGQAGIAIQNGQFDGLNLAGKPLASPTHDGFGNLYGNDTNALFNRPQVNLANATGFTGADSRFIVGDAAMGMHIHLDSAEINIDSMTTELMMGDKSMGTIGIKGLNVKISGDVYIFVRN
ncbi:MAG: hypothetical protein C4522_09365 [Desulfobacteraceae bacterium]|nr:MAG: hypothetical protein C4522_09365 [Desulfobacteraceae bacterium]